MGVEILEFQQIAFYFLCVIGTFLLGVPVAALIRGELDSEDRIPLSFIMGCVYTCLPAYWLSMLGLSMKYAADILDETAVGQCMEKEKPDAVIHLAAISNVPLSWEKPGLTVEVNVKGTITVFLAFAHANPQGVFLNIGSSDEYGLTAKKGVPLTEDMPCQPQNPYAISKLCAEQMVLQFGKKHGVKVISTRSFNHFGPGQAKGFVVSDFASQIAEIERGEREPVIRTGNLSAVRDFTYVADVVDAYALLLEKDAPAGVYNICSGRAVKIQEILDTLLSLAKVEIRAETDENKLRPVDVPFFVGNANKVGLVTGWKSTSDFRTKLECLLRYKG